jgi:hypothetical protein
MKRSKTSALWLAVVWFFYISAGFFFLISNTGREYTRRREKNEKRKKIIYFYFLILLIDLMLLHFYYSFYFVVEQFLFSIISRRSGYTFHPHRTGLFFICISYYNLFIVFYLLFNVNRNKWAFFRDWERDPRRGSFSTFLLRVVT